MLRLSFSGLRVWDCSKQYLLGNRHSNVAESWAWRQANDITAVYDRQIT